MERPKLKGGEPVTPSSHALVFGMLLPCEAFFVVVGARSVIVTPEGRQVRTGLEIRGCGLLQEPPTLNKRT